MLRSEWTLLIFSTITTARIWRGFQFVDVERTTVAHLYICTITTTVTTITSRIAKTYFPRDHAILNWRMASLQPSCIWSIAIAGSISTTCGHLFAWYKPVPSFSQIVVILTTSWRRETFPSGVVIYGPVRLAFRFFCTWKKNKQTNDNKIKCRWSELIFLIYWVTFKNFYQSSVVGRGKIYFRHNKP